MALSVKKKLPVGIEFFDELIRQDFYYVDKTRMIADLLHHWGKVNLFTRPRRFGKSLNMSMLQSFFEIGCDKTVFEGLQIVQESELCEEYMGRFPVISISLKGVDGLQFTSACMALKGIIGTEAMRFQFLEKSERLSQKEKEIYGQLVRIDREDQSVYAMSESVLCQSLLNLSALLAKHYQKPVILLIDEYDVPLDKAFQYGYYEEMVSLIRNLFGNVLKTNPNLHFAVLTGCLRVSKESIFTGLNNLKVMTIADTGFAEYFGFTDAEVRGLLNYYGLEAHYESVKKWYDGYQFGKTEIYCPWDVLCYCDKLRMEPGAEPEDFWSNTSGNAIVRRFIDRANMQTRNEIEQLIAGKQITKEIRQELTYSELDNTIENLWSVLFTTGYLTCRGKKEGKKYDLVIPNAEIRELFITQIREWFKGTVGKDRKTLDAFCGAFLNKDVETIQNLFGNYLWNTISIRDTAAMQERKENFYHGILLGLFGFMENWVVKSNLESGIGYSDILIEVPEGRVGIVIELKYADDGKMDVACERALKQITEKHYTARLKEDGMQTILEYGIACCKKDCRVMGREEKR